MRPHPTWLRLACACLLTWLPLLALATPARPAADGAQVALPAGTRSGLEIYTRFHDGLADTSCKTDSSQRWQAHFSKAPAKLAAADRDVLALFGYVVDALREANLPTEYALIPFVESGYRPEARSATGPAGLWQFIAITARNHKVGIRPGYDGRLSPVESTQAAVRYLKTLHGMFAGDWRLAVMAYNAGEYRVLGALKRSGQRAATAQPDKLVGMPGITVAYVRKLHALACVLDHADDNPAWLRAIDRPVPNLVPVTLPAGAASLDTYAARRGLDADLLKRLNPAFAGGRVAGKTAGLRILAPGASTADDQPDTAPAIGMPAEVTTTPAQTTTLADAEMVVAAASPLPPVPVVARTHTVARGDSIWRVAHRYGLRSDELLTRNGLTAASVLRPGMVLKLDDASP